MYSIKSRIVRSSIAMTSGGICTLNSSTTRAPRTVAAIGSLEIVEAARKFSGSFITKHNRAGKGLGVRLFRDVDSVQDYVLGPEFQTPIDGITLVQECIESPQPYITRVEFVGGKFLYAVRVDTSEGFELCPADVCSTQGITQPRFSIIQNFRHPIIVRYERFLKANDIHIAGIEFIIDKYGQLFTYDVNTNTNYNSEAEQAIGLSGMTAISRYLGNELTYVTNTHFGVLQTSS